MRESFKFEHLGWGNSPATDSSQARTSASASVACDARLPSGSGDGPPWPADARQATNTSQVTNRVHSEQKPS
jgi:hypothetical protein